MGFPGGSDGKESTCNAGDLGLIPGSGRSPGYPLQYSCLENPMDRGGAWQAMVHTVAMSWTRLRQLSTHAHILQTHGFLESDLVKILAL